MRNEAAARAYADYFATLTPGSIPTIRDMAIDGLRFKDPFNDFVGLDRMVAMLTHMFETATEPEFVIRDVAVAGNIAFISWDFTCRTRGLHQLPIVLTGVSELRFDDQGRLVEHIDHWDAASQLFARLPLFGGLFRWFNRRFSAPV